jgi:hypothetical protein
MDGWVSTKWIEKHTKRAADRERRRIRRAQARLIRDIRDGAAAGEIVGADGIAEQLDAATRTPRVKRRRGK